MRHDRLAMSPQPTSAELRAQLEEAGQRERAVGEILRTISHPGFDLGQVLQTVIDNAVRLSHAEFGNLARLNETTGGFTQAVFYGDVSAEFWAALSRVEFRPEPHTLIGRTLMERRPVQIHDALADPEYRFPEAQRIGGYRTILGVPMLRNDVAIGVIVLNRRIVKPFTDREIALVSTLADQATLAVANVSLFRTVQRQRTELARFAPQVADLLSDAEGEGLLAGHRRQISAMFADLRQFTAFAEVAEPEEVLGVLRAFHQTVGQVIQANGGTIEHFAGDGLLAFFNDPTVVPDHERTSVTAAIEIRRQFRTLAMGWQEQGYELGLGIGIATGYATLGRIGFEGRYDYGAIGTVVILASRLSDAAEADEILVSQRIRAVLDDEIECESAGVLQLKGFSRPVPAFKVIGPRS